MNKSVFTNEKNGKFYTTDKQGFFSVEFKNPINPNYLIAKNGKKYFIADLHPVIKYGIVKVYVDEE